MDNLSEALVSLGERNVTYPVPGREDGHAYLSPFNTDSQYGVIVIQEWWGLNKALCTTADTLAKQGFRALSPDVYRGKCAKNREEAGHLMSGLDWVGAVQDISAAGAFLRSQGCTKVGITGFCMGGALTLVTLAHDQTFNAGAPFYGVPDLSKNDLSKAKMPIQAHFGALDQAKGFSSPEDAQRLEEKAKELGLNLTVVMWPEAGHAFMNQDSSMYHPVVAQKALAQVVDFFNTIFSQ